jgi:N-methylhydantoinase A
LNTDAKAGWRKAFDEVHEKHFGSRAEDQKVEIVNYRLTTKVVVPKPVVAESSLGVAHCAGALKARRKAYFDGWHDTPIYDRVKLVSGNRIAGPAIIEQMDSTTVVHPGHEAQIDRFGNIIIDINRARS